jgi:hypothetical protein
VSGQTPISDAVWPLLDAICDNALTEAQSQQLAAVLDSDVAVRTLLMEHVRLQIDIRCLCQARRACDGGLARVRAMLPEPSCVASHVPTLLSAPFPSTYGYFSSGWTVSYLSATVLTGLLLLGFWLMPASTPKQIARQPDVLLSSPSPLTSVVGRITGMADCQFKAEGGRRKAERLESRVSLGDTVALTAGLLEITYNTGAKVILQGPVKYQVESNGGFLSLGKLTGKLEKEVASGQWPVASTSTINNQQSTISSPSSFILHPSSFTIRTPTAAVTDLGTEFGVEVTKDRQTRTHVFQGRIVVRPQALATSAASASREMELAAGESASVTPLGTVLRLAGAQSRATAKTIDFVRTIPKLTGKVFSYDFESLSLKPGDLLGQDGWTGHTASNPSLRVVPGTDANRTQVIAGSGADCRRFKWCRDWLPATAGMTVTEEYWAYPVEPKKEYLVMGAWWAGESNPSAALFGISGGKWYVREAGPRGVEYFGDGGIKANHWYNVKLVVDFSVPGGAATLYHRDLTAGEESFVQDSLLRNVEMHVPTVPWSPAATARYEIMGISACIWGSGAADNFSFRIDGAGQAEPTDEPRKSEIENRDQR